MRPSATTLALAIVAALPSLGNAETHTFSFDDVSAGRLPDKWKYGTGTWSVVEDRTAPSGTKVMAQTKTTNFGTRQYPAVFYTKATYADFAVTVKWRPVSGQIDASGGIVFRARDGANYYVVRGNSLESNFGLYKCVDGMRIPIAFREPIDRPALNEWHTMRVVCDGNRIRAWMDGTLMIDGRDDLYDKGMVGLWTKADAVTYFDDFIITTRDDEEEAAAPSSWSHVTVVLVAIAGAACVFLLGFFFPRRSPASPEQGGGS